MIQLRPTQLGSFCPFAIPRCAVVRPLEIALQPLANRSYTSCDLGACHPISLQLRMVFAYTFQRL